MSQLKVYNLPDSISYDVFFCYFKISPRISRNAVGLLKGNTKEQKVLFMLFMVLEHGVHTVNFKRSSDKVISTFHFALRTIKGLRSGEISTK